MRLGELWIIPAWWGIEAAAVVLLVLLAFRILRRNRQVDRQPIPDLFVDVSELDASGPPASGPRAEFYGLPVRLAVVVVAPGGRQGELPPPEVLPGLIDRLVPGLSSVIASHRPLICRWPVQLSTQGFSQRFLNLMALPGDHGKGTPWCSISGKLKVGDRLFLIGIVCCAQQPNGLGQVVVQHEGQWLDILRIRDE
ncbi:MAG: hypothetical protein ACYC3X_07485 [Pirellulaceae bacterium]